MHPRLQKAMNDVVTKDLCEKLVADTRNLALRQSMLVKDPLAKSLMMAHAARELLVAASAAMCYALKDDMTPKQSMEILLVYITERLKSMLDDIKDDHDINQPIGDIDTFMQNIINPELIEHLLKTLKNR